MKRIVFFDGPCPMCNWFVKWLMEADSKEIFLFSSLQGKTAEEKGLPKDSESIILLDGKKRYEAAKAIMKIFWLLGGKYMLIGWMYYMPQFLMHPWYRLIARNRYRICKSGKQIPLDSKRLLP